VRLLTDSRLVIAISAIRRTLRRTIEADPVPAGFLPSGCMASDFAAMDRLHDEKHRRVGELRTLLADHCERLQHLRAGR